MKAKFLMPLVIGCLLVFTACNDDDDDNIKVPQEVSNAFKARYPDASRVSWEKEHSYYVADFWRSDMSAEAEAWYDGAAKWYLTVTEIGYNSLPQPVKTAYTAGEYAAWRVDDTDMVERDGFETVYVLEVEKGNQEYDLYYTSDGTLVKAVPDNGGNNDPGDYLPDGINSAIRAYIAQAYPNARIVDIDDSEVSGIEVDILDGTTYREVMFSLSGEWLGTATGVTRAEVPQSIMDAFQGSQYAGYQIDDIDHYVVASGGEFYLFELEAEPEDIYVKVSMDGTVEEVNERQ